MQGVPYGVMPVPTKGKSSSQTMGFSTDNAGAEEKGVNANYLCS